MSELKEVLKYTNDLVKNKPEKSSFWHYRRLVDKIEEIIAISNEIRFTDIGQDFVVVRDDLVEIEKGKEVVLLTINASGMHQFIDKDNEYYYLEANCVRRKNI